MEDRITIGELSRRTGLAVRTLRFYSDRGLIVPAARSEAGYRLYDADAVARVALVRTLRELGVDLPTIGRVLDRELGLADVATAHAAALETQIRVLRHALIVTRLAARRDCDPKEMTLMHELARLSAADRRRIVDDFLDDVLRGLDVDPALAQRMRMTRPDLPDEPTPEQIEAWVELAELVADDDFRRTIRRMSERGAADRASADAHEGAREAAKIVAERAGAAIAGGVDPSSPEAGPIVGEIVAAYAVAMERHNDAEFHGWLVELIDTFADARAERYWQLLAIINGWPPRPATVPAWAWLAEGLRTSA